MKPRKLRRDDATVKPRKGYRTLVIGKYVFQWRVGKTYVCIYDPLGFKDTPTKSQIVGHEIVPGEKVEVTPAHIVAWINKDLIKGIKLN